MPGRRLRIRSRGALLIGALAAAWAITWGLGAWRYRAELDRADREIAAKDFASARERLSALDRRWPGRGEVLYPLGLCERAAGRLEAAQEAWARIPPDSPLFERAALEAEQVALARGRLADVEAILESARRHPGPRHAEVLRRLIRLYQVQGRAADVARLIEEAWEGADDPAALLREHAALDLEAPPTGGLEGFLDRAGRDAPDDDRVWLARANLAIRSGRLEEAAGLLESCLGRRPEDPAAWRARLELAKEGGDVEGVRRALGHLPVDAITEEAALRLRAWAASRRGDWAAERRALEEYAGRNPAALAALDRLAGLAHEGGEAQRAADLRRRKAELDRTRNRYHTLLFKGEGRAQAAELARLAASLGRWFEARGFATLFLRLHPDDREARAVLARAKAAEEQAGRPVASISALVAELRPANLAGSGAAAGGETPSARPDFVDDAGRVGLRFTHRSGRSPLRQLPETQSGGVGVLDFDGDGWLDVYCVQGGHFPPDPGEPGDGDRLFRNRGDGTFEDATEASGIAGLSRGYGHGAAVGDYDGDGDPDLFVTRWRGYALYRNRGDGRFEEVTDEAGLGGDRDWPTSAAWADLDGDGDLDLYVCHYVAWDAEHPRICRDPATHAYLYCPPRQLDALPDHAFRNDGGRFVDVTAEAGLGAVKGPALGVVAADLDDDRRIDLYVANDGTPNFLFRNLGGFRFEEVGAMSGVASSADGVDQAGMGVACGDLDGDGAMDLVVTNYYGESATYYRNLGGGMFGDRTASSGLGAASRYLLGFGVALFDFDADGRLDLATANGHVNDLSPNIPHAMPAQLLAGAPEGRLVDVSGRAGPPWKVLRLGRGLASGDLDNDGRVDLLILGQDQPLAYLHNRTPGGHSVTLRLEGGPSNRDGVGARVTVESGGRRLVAQRVGGGSYQSARDPRLHFGLGDATQVDSIEVAWPSGRVDRHIRLPANAGYLLREGEAAPGPLAAFAGRDAAFRVKAAPKSGGVAREPPEMRENH